MLYYVAHSGLMGLSLNPQSVSFMRINIVPTTKWFYNLKWVELGNNCSKLKDFYLVNIWEE